MKQSRERIAALIDELMSILNYLSWVQGGNWNKRMFPKDIYQARLRDI